MIDNNSSDHLYGVLIAEKNLFHIHRNEAHFVRRWLENSSV